MTHAEPNYAAMLAFVAPIVSLAALYVVWDLGRRWLAARQQHYDAIANTMLTQFTDQSERNNKALVNFLSEMSSLTKYVEKARREAEGQLLTGKRR